MSFNILVAVSVEPWIKAHAATFDALASVAVVATLIFIAHQTRHSARLAGVDSLRNSMIHLAQVESVFVDRPHLRAYFHNGASLPTDPDIKAQILTVASGLADCLESAIFHADTFAGDDVDDWCENARDYLTKSPALRRVVSEHPHWWPDVAKEYSNVQRTAPAASLRGARRWWRKPIVAVFIKLANRTCGRLRRSRFDSKSIEVLPDGPTVRRSN